MTTHQTGERKGMTRDDWPTLLAGYVQELHALSRSPETIRTRMHYLRRWAADHDPDADRGEIVAWLGEHEWAPATRKSAQASLRGFYRWMVKAGHLEHSPAAELDPVSVPKKLPRPAREDQVDRGCRATDGDDVLMVRLAAHAGLRRSEIARLRREDLTAWGLHIIGKGGRHRIVPVTPDLRRLIEERPAGYLFPGRFTGHVHPATVQKHVREAAGVAPHAHRHRFATQAYAGTRNLLAVQQLLGHESPETTQVYVALVGDGLMDAVRAAA